MSKGSKTRVKDHKQYRDSYDNIFKKEDKNDASQSKKPHVTLQKEV